MRKYFTTGIIVIALFSGCDLVFQEEDSLFLINTEEEVEGFLNGIYYNLSEVHNSSYFYLLARSNDIKLAPSGFRIGNNEYKEDYSINNPDGENVKDLVYMRLYQAIISANKLIYSLNEDVFPQYMGEVYFLRAYCYFKLARFFGRPPLIDNIIVSYQVPLPTHRQVYEFIIADFQRAIELLPESPDETRINGQGLSQASAKALLAEVYLAMGGYPVKDQSKYAQAALLAREVIEQSDVYGFGLVEDYSDLWSGGETVNQECIFGIYPSHSPFENDLHRLRIFNLSSPNAQQEYSTHASFKPSHFFYNQFPESYRRSKTFFSGYYRLIEIEIPGGTEHILGFEPYDTWGEYVCCVGFTKWLDFEDVHNDMNRLSYDSHETTCYLYRYAQLLLTFAEASVRSGNVDQLAIEAVNKVIRRAHRLDLNQVSNLDLSPEISDEALLEAVVNERRWELCFEPEGRWFDVVRLELRDTVEEMLTDGEQTVHPEGDRIISEDWYFYVLPAEDRWLNPGLDEK